MGRGSADPEMLRVGLIGAALLYLPVWIAERLGYFERCGLRVSTRAFDSPHEVTHALRGGELDLALSTPEGAIIDRVSGGQLRVLAGLTNRPPLSLIAHRRHRRPQDLRGARIGVSSMTEGVRHLAQRMLADAGLTYPGDYEFVLTGTHKDRWNALQEGTIDAAAQMVPFDHIAEEAGFTNLGDVADHVPYFAFNAVAARQDFASAHSDVVVRFLRGLLDGTAFFHHNVEESARIAAQATAIEPRLALLGCRAVQAKGLIATDLRFIPQAFDVTVATLRMAGELPSPERWAAAPETVLDYTYLERAESHI